MEKKPLRILAALLALALLLSCCPVLPLQVSAASSGTCGANLTWTLDDAGTLTISGTGKMYEYVHMGSYAPWYSNRSSIQ